MTVSYIKMKDELTIVKILYAQPHLGGSGAMGLQLGRELARRGHHIHIVSYDKTVLSEEDEVLMAIHPVENLKRGPLRVNPLGFTFPGKVYQINKDNPVDILHAHYAITHGAAVVDARDIINREQRMDGIPPQRRVAAVITNHGTDVSINGYNELMNPALELRLSQADGISFVSEDLQNVAKSIFRLENYGTVIYNFGDPKPYEKDDDERQRVRKKYNIPDDTILFYHSSNLRPVKNIPFILYSWARLISERRRKDCHLMIIGDGEEREDLEQIVGELKIGDSVTFTGQIREDEVPAYTKAGDVLLLPSQKESFGLVNLEAMYAGNAIIASRVGGIPEVVSHEENGYLFRIGNQEEFIFYMKWFLDNRQLIREFGEQGKLIAKRKFSPVQIVSEYEAFYYGVLEQARA